MTEQPTTWVVTDGAAGNEKQCLALAQFAGVRPEVFRLALRKPWEWLAPHFRNGGRRAIVGPLRDRLSGQLPELLITCGRRATLASTTIKRLSGGATFTVHLLDPKIDPGLFDLVICPQHDQLTGTNVLTSLGALNDITDEALLSARRDWAPQIAAHPEPRFVVLIGASNANYRVDDALITQIADTVDGWIAQYGGSVLVSTSRRTPDEIKTLVWQRFAGKGRVWTGSDADVNPYLGFLAYADALVVTPDSVNMCSEAAATGKPVYVIGDQTDHGKFSRFHQMMRASGYQRALTAPLDLTAVAPLRETADLAEQLMKRFRANNHERCSKR